MAIHTSAITYRRGIPNGYNNFYFVAQANNTIPAPMALYIKGFNFYNRNFRYATSGRQTYPWRN
jgi:hypothetical protein